MQQLYIYPEHRSDGGLLPAVCVGVWTEKLKKKTKQKAKQMNIAGVSISS